jgi:hypothetical protein
MKFHGVPVDKPSRLVAEVDVPPFHVGSGLSAVAVTKAAIASANVGGIGGGLGVSSWPRGILAPSCAWVRDGIWSKEIFEKYNMLIYHHFTLLKM